MAQGRGNAYYAATVLLLLLGLRQASAVTYTVGGSSGWDVNVDYTTWAAGLTFKVGDVLFFPYMQSAHNVVVVNKADYDACSETNASATFTAGNTNVTLSAAGAHYYLCSLPGHCPAGMKLAVSVAAATTASPTPSPPASAPAPVKTPSSAPSPTKTPASSPAAASSEGTPASAPAPTPASAPASAPASSPTLTPASEGTPASSPSTAGTPPPSPSPPNSAQSLLASAALSPLLAAVAVAAASLFVSL
eukprot:c1260_g1_i1 orf=189-932(+)